MIYTKLLDHQKKILEFTVKRKYFGIFADYGTGKTLCALAHINFFQYNKVLVVSTKTAIHSTWIDEIRKHTDFNYILINGSKRDKQQKLQLGLRKAQISPATYHSGKKHVTIFLINFEGVKNIFTELSTMSFDFVVVDESTKLKAPETQRTQIMWALAKYINSRCIMTGFPITENFADIYSQIKFLDLGENFGNSYYAFINRYFNKVAYKLLPRKKGVEEILTKIKIFCIRITNAELNLPPKVYKIVHIDPTKQQTEMLKELNDYFRLEFGKVKIDTEYVFTLINKSLQVCSGFIKGHDASIESFPTNKDETLADLLDEIDITRNKVIIWCAYRHSVDKLYRLLKTFSPMVLTGATKNVNATIRHFQDGKSNIMIAIQKKAAESITLTSCNYAIYYENSWSADLRYNSEARIRRKGSEIHQHIFYTDFVVRDTIEERVLECLKQKKNLVDDLKEQFTK